MDPNRPSADAGPVSRVVPTEIPQPPVSPKNQESDLKVTTAAASAMGGTLALEPGGGTGAQSVAAVRGVTKKVSADAELVKRMTTKLLERAGLATPDQRKAMDTVEAMAAIAACGQLAGQEGFRELAAQVDTLTGQVQQGNERILSEANDHTQQLASQARDNAKKTLEAVADTKAELAGAIKRLRGGPLEMRALAVQTALATMQIFNPGLIAQVALVIGIAAAGAFGPAFFDIYDRIMGRFPKSALDGTAIIRIVDATNFTSPGPTSAAARQQWQTKMVKGLLGAAQFIDSKKDYSDTLRNGLAQNLSWFGEGAANWSTDNTAYRDLIQRGQTYQQQMAAGQGGPSSETLDGWIDNVARLICHGFGVEEDAEAGYFDTEQKLDFRRVPSEVREILMTALGAEDPTPKPPNEGGAAASSG